MTLRSLRLSSIPAVTATPLAIALALGSFTGLSPAEAARLSHSRVVSAQGAPLQVLIGIDDLTPEEQGSLRVTVADPASWQRAGLAPPVPLASMTVRVEPGANASSRNVRVLSSSPANAAAVDLLLDMTTSAGRRQLQLTVMQSERGGMPELVEGPTVGAARRGVGGSVGTLGVRQGDTLYGIAQSHAVADATIYQMLVALWRANPQAFIVNNMNLVKAGVTLRIPDAATVRAIDPAEARRIFLEQQEAFARYRNRLAGQASRAAPAVERPGASGQVESTPAAPAEPSTQDRVRLSSGQPGQGPQSAVDQAQARADAQTSAAKATQDAQTRVAELERNIKDLNSALATNEPAASGSNATGSGTAASAAGAGSTSGIAADPSALGGTTGSSGTPGSAAGAGGASVAPPGGAGAGASSTGASNPGTGLAPNGGAAAAGTSAATPTTAAGTPGTTAPGNSAPGNGAPGNSAQGTAPDDSAQAGSGTPGTPAGPATGSGASGAAAGAAGDASAVPGAATGAGRAAGATDETPRSGAPSGNGVSPTNAPTNGQGPANGAAPGTTTTSGAGTATDATNGVGSGTPATNVAPGTATTNGAPGATTTNGAGPGTTTTNGAGPATTTTNGAGPSSPAASGPAVGTVPATGAAQRPASGLPAWLSDNLLIVVTVVLAFIAFIIAWLLRRAGARRADEQEEEEALYTAQFDREAVERKLRGIDLDLDEFDTPRDSDGRREPTAARDADHPVKGDGRREPGAAGT
jgi:pilus assembly protein FimV